MSFLSLGLAPALAQAAAELGFSAPTPIQAEAIPAVLAGHDLLATAQTGSGKTAAYALPLLQALTRSEPRTPRPVRALVLVPTRELVTQATEVLQSLARHLPVRPKLAVAFGGVSINPQMMALRGGADVVVATPGRLLDLVAHNAVRLSGVECLVLDEADRLLDAGFAEELARVLDLLPARRQNLFFSATFPPSVQALADGLMHAPVRIDLAPPTQEASLIEHQAFLVDAKRRTQLLRHLIKTQAWSQVLVFVATKYAAEHLAAKLHHGDLYATPFHGDLSQGARQQVLEQFKDGRWDVVVTTDLAARGLHIDQLPVVVNFDLPRSTVDYTHRIGRTGRAGERGLAVSFVSPATQAHWRLIEKRQQLSLPRVQAPGFEVTEEAPPASPGAGGVKGKRPSKKDKLRAAAAKAGQATSPEQPEGELKPGTRA